MKLHYMACLILAASVVGNDARKRKLSSRKSSKGGSADDGCYSFTITERLAAFDDPALNYVTGDGETPGDVAGGNAPIWDESNEKEIGTLNYLETVQPGQLLGTAMYTFTDNMGNEVGQISVLYTDSDPFLKAINGGTGIYACATGEARTPEPIFEGTAPVEFVICGGC